MAFACCYCCCLLLCLAPLCQAACTLGRLDRLRVVFVVSYARLVLAALLVHDGPFCLAADSAVSRD